jgi:hypothetical protein
LIVCNTFECFDFLLADYHFCILEITELRDTLEAIESKGAKESSVLTNSQGKGPKIGANYTRRGLEVMLQRINSLSKLEKASASVNLCLLNTPSVI